MLLTCIGGLGTLALCGMLACATPQSVAPEARRGESRQAHAQPEAVGHDLEDFIRHYETDRAAVDRFYDLPWSELRFDRLEQIYQDTSQRLARLDFATLNQQGRVDYIVLRNHLTARLTQLARQRQRLAEMEELLLFRKALLDLEIARRQMEPLDPSAAATTLARVTEQIKTLRERLERDGPASATQEAGTQEATTQQLQVSTLIAQRAADATDALQQTLGAWYSFYDDYEPSFSWWIDKPYEEVRQAMQDYGDYLRKEVAGLKGEPNDPLIGESLGAEALAEALAAELIAYTPAELIAIGEQQLAWCETELKKAAAEMGLGDDWKAALAKVKEDHVPPGSQDDLVTELSREAIRFVKQHELVTIPPLCEETWRITMISQEEQKVLPFAAYGGQNIKVAYPTAGMEHADKLMSMRGNNRHFSRLVVPHELIPGHHLQAFMAARHRAYREIFWTPFYAEGWALYWEMLLWDLDYAQTPEDRIGMLFWRMHRAARIIVSLKFHLGQMTPAEMVDFLVERVGHERFGATSEVRRYIADDYGPLYQCSYLTGGLQLRALRREVVDSGKMTEREYHDALLMHGPIPNELIRAAMLDVPLSPDMQASWRFAGEPLAR